MTRSETSKRSYSKSWEERHDEKKVPKRRGHCSVSWLYQTLEKEHAWVTPLREKFQSDFEISRGYKCVTNFLLAGTGTAGDAVHKITKSQELHLMDLARLCMAIWESRAR